MFRHTATCIVHPTFINLFIRLATTKCHRRHTVDMSHEGACHRKFSTVKSFVVRSSVGTISMHSFCDKTIKSMRCRCTNRSVGNCIYVACMLNRNTESNTHTHVAHTWSEIESTMMYMCTCFIGLILSRVIKICMRLFLQLTFDSGRDGCESDRAGVEHKCISMNSTTCAKYIVMIGNLHF